MTVPPLAGTVASFDARSATYDESRMHHAVAAEAVAAADPQEGHTLLDVAGGTGLVAHCALPRLGARGRALVLDASPGMLRQAQGKQLEAVQADAHRLPVRDRSVDRVTCVTALHLFHDPQRALSEASRACRADGLVVFTTWAVGAWSSSRALRRAAAAEGVDVPDPFAPTGTADAAAALARQSRLQPQDVRLVRHVEPLTDPDHEWERAAATTAAAGTPGATTERVRQRFLQELGSEVEHLLLLVTCRPT